MIYRVYVAGPIGLRDKGHAARVATGVEATRELLTAGFAVHCPHLLGAAGIDVLSVIDEVWVPTCHALLRLPGESDGADGEVALAHRRSIPVFYSVAELVRWRDGLESRKPVCQAHQAGNVQCPQVPVFQLRWVVAGQPAATVKAVCAEHLNAEVLGRDLRLAGEVNVSPLQVQR